jgi:hypothetical protein
MFRATRRILSILVAASGGILLAESVWAQTQTTRALE